MHREEYLQQFAIVDLVGIESDAHHFHMPGVSVAHLAIIRLAGASAHVTGLDVGYAGQTLKNGFNTPEASAAEDRCLLFCHDDWMYRRARSFAVMSTDAVSC